MPIAAREIAALLGGELASREDEVLLTGYASLSRALADQVTFCQERTAGKVQVQAGLVLVPKDFDGWPGEARALLRVDHPYHAMVRTLEHFFRPSTAHALSRISPSAIVHPSAVVEGVVGDHARIGPNCVVMRGAEVGAGCHLHASVTLYRGVVLGPRNELQAGVVMGSRGFGFYEYQGERLPVPHYAGVRTGADCEFGPHTVVAAGFLDPTEIGDRCVFDSFVQIAHNCRLGNDIVCCSQSGLAGSVVVEDRVTLAGGAQVAGHLTLGRGCTVAAKAGVTKPVRAGETVAGFPAVPIAQWRREIAGRRKIEN